MFKVNDYIVYGVNGVCQITDIRKDNYNNIDETEYYVLNPVYSNNMTIMVPVNNPNIVMRSIITENDVLSIIAIMTEKETIWIDDNKQRSNDFKAALRTGKPEEWIKIIKTLYEAKSVLGKKLTKADEDIFNTTEERLNQEFSIALNISSDEVVPYILEHISLN